MGISQVTHYLGSCLFLNLNKLVKNSKSILNLKIFLHSNWPNGYDFFFNIAPIEIYIIFTEIKNLNFVLKSFYWYFFIKRSYFIQIQISTTNTV